MPNKGFSLIETMLALLILALVSTVIIAISLQVTSLVNSTKLKNQNVTLSQQMLEQVRGFYQQNGWAGLVAKAPSPTCYTDATLNSGSISCPADLSDPVNSQIVRLTPYSDHIKVEISVNWAWKGQPQKVQTQTYFYSY